MGLIQIYRGEDVLATVTIENDTVFSQALNAEDKVEATFHSNVAVPLLRNDYIYVSEKAYQILDFVDITINHKYAYQATLLATNYSLLNKPFTNAAGLSTFRITSTATGFLTLIVGSINTFNSGWTVGTVDDDDSLRTIEFTKDDCRSALGKVFREFGLEVSFNVKEISLSINYETEDDPIELAYGMGNGLSQITKRVSGEFFTRVIGFGSTRNIPADYRGGLERLTYDPGYADIADAGSFVEQKAIEVQFEEIYPHRTGSLSSVGTPDAEGQLVADSTIDFNLADNFITGEVAKIVMSSGNWIGSEFEIIQNTYDNGAKSFRIRANKEAGYTIPSVSFPLQAGDTYVFIGINLPQSYIDTAEAQLASATAGYAATKPVLDVVVGMELDPIYVEQNDLVGELKIGRKVHVTNTPQGIDLELKVISISYPLNNPEQITVVISDKVQYSEDQQIQRIIIDSVKSIPVIKENIEAVKRFTSRRLDENLSLVFDPLGNYYSEKIAPLSIETLQLVVGSRAQVFALSSIMQANYAGAPNSFGFTTGTLVHYTVNPGSTYTWNITGGLITGLTGATPYYIYARCNKANDTGVIVLDTTARQIESDSTYYYFLIGTLNSEDGGVRAITLSYGTAEVNGKFIKGTLISDDTLTYIDLNAGVIKGKLSFLKADESGYIDGVEVSEKALQAFDDATDAKTKTDLLKDLAFEDLVEAAMLGTTIIDGGYIKTDLIDVDYIKANFINAAYIATLDIDAVMGTIGGITINAGSISAPNFTLTAAGSIAAVDVDITGTITATAGYIGGNEITSNGIIGAEFSIIDGSLTAINAYFEDLEVVGFIAEDAIITGLEATDVLLNGSIVTGTTGERIELLSVDQSLTFYDASSTEIFQLKDGKIVMNGSADSYVSVQSGGVGASIGFVPTTIWGQSSTVMGTFINDVASGNSVAIQAGATGGVNNLAMQILNGDLSFETNTSKIRVIDSSSVPRVGLETSVSLQKTGGGNWTLTFVNGILTSAT